MFHYKVFKINYSKWYEEKAYTFKSIHNSLVSSNIIRVASINIRDLNNSLGSFGYLPLGILACVEFLEP